MYQWRRPGSKPGPWQAARHRLTTSEPWQGEAIFPLYAHLNSKVVYEREMCNLWLSFKSLQLRMKREKSTQHPLAKPRPLLNSSEKTTSHTGFFMVPTGSPVTEKGGPLTQQVGLQVSTWMAAAHMLHRGRRSTGAITRIRCHAQRFPQFTLLHLNNHRLWQSPQFYLFVKRFHLS